MRCVVFLSCFFSKCVNAFLVPKLIEKVTKKGGRTRPERCLERTKGEKKGKRMLDVRPCPGAPVQRVSTLCMSVHSPVCCGTQRTLSKTPRLRTPVTSQPILPPPAPTSSLVFPSPPLVDEKIGVPGRASWSGGGRGVDPHSCSPVKQSSKPSWISNKNLCRETACRWQCNAVPLPAPPPRLTS